MRRADRAVTAEQEILTILEECIVCRLGMSVNDTPYVVPLNFGFEYEEGKLTLYFHSGNQGKKLEMLRGNPKVCFEMDCAAEVVANEQPCSFSMRFKSVIGTGRVEFLVADADKLHGLRVLLRNIDKTKDFKDARFTDTQLRGVTVFKLSVDEFEVKCAK